MTNYKPNNFDNETKIRCACCGKILNERPGMANVKMVYHFREDGTKEYVSVTPVCKGICDERMQVSHDMYDGWFDLEDLYSPLIYMDKVLSIMSGMQRGTARFTYDAMQAMKDLLYATAPYVFRDATDKEKAEYNRLFR